MKKLSKCECDRFFTPCGICPSEKKGDAMNASKHDINQEEIEMAEREAHDNGICMGIPLCGYCLDDWEEQLEEWDRLAYYNSRGNLEK